MEQKWSEDLARYLTEQGFELHHVKRDENGRLRTTRTQPLYDGLRDTKRLHLRQLVNRDNGYIHFGVLNKLESASGKSAPRMFEGTMVQLCSALGLSMQEVFTLSGISMTDLTECYWKVI